MIEVLLFSFRNLSYPKIYIKILAKLYYTEFYGLFIGQKSNIWMKKPWLMRILVFAIRKSAQRFRFNDHVFSRLLCSTHLCTKKCLSTGHNPFFKLLF